MGRHSLPGSGDSTSGPADHGSGDEPSGRIPRADGGWQGRRRRTDGGRRGVSVGVIAALITVVVLVAGVILWRFFGGVLSKRSTDAAQQCLEGTAEVAVVADPSIVDNIASFADQFNSQNTPVGDVCVNVAVRDADSDAVYNGLTGSWPGDLGAIPALWIPASSIQPARLQVANGKQAVIDARSLVSTPVVLAVAPQVKNALGQDGWPALPDLQTDPSALDGRDLPGWGSLRLALPTVGGADATYLAAEAVATTSAPDGSPTGGLGAVSTLLSGQPRLADNTAQTAWNALIAPGDPAVAPVHGVVMTEQQVFARSATMPEDASPVASWLPAGPVAQADYPTVLLSGPWLTEEQVAAASQFARFLRKPDQVAKLTDAGFRAPGAVMEGNDVVGFPELGDSLAVGDDALRTALAGAVAPAAGAVTTVMLDQNLTGVTDALQGRIAALPPGAVVGLWTFDGTEGAEPVPAGPLGEDLGGQPRSAVLAAVLDGLSPAGSGAVSFTTLRLVYGDAVANYRPGQPNSVLVVTSGPHTDRTLDGPGLQDYVRSALDPERPVRINVIDVGDDPDRPTWESVAANTGGGYLNLPATDSPELISAIGRLLG